ncbi:hypothetical protein QWZ16_17380 [Vibrio ostreicida]|uniref:SH3 domain-containing protein n=2 Tax=Vibrio ostreicida TaxID=526588 RepID=A0ABT8BYA8_9VIBR|nr:hypothetical protein [Vibrio ostreicida]MDN3611376.1 hypothetical protein [Vibrio ostreicida]
MFIMLLLGVACAGGGYYIFFLKPQQDAEEAAMNAEATPPPPQEEKAAPPVPAKPEVMDYYVSPERLGIREFPDHKAFIESVVYRGDKLKILEKKDGWGRVSDYYVYEEGGEEIAEWVPMDALLEVAPTISKEERMETISRYIEKSDDFKQFFDMFILKTGQLITDKTCVPEDFEETSGWVRSTTFRDRDVYFVYCGGIKQANKVYLDVQSGEIFYRQPE